jgi:uncharacterized membrane protein
MSRWVIAWVAIVGAAFAFSAWYGPSHLGALPERVPTHWNIRMEPDQWKSREEVRANPFVTLYAFPTGMAVLAVAALALPWMSPRTFSLDEFRPTFDYGIALALALMGYLHVVILIGILGGDGPSARALFAGMCLFFALMGNILGKVRSNFWMGVRTPWTLASPKVWERTHRLAAWLWVATGLAGFILALVLPQPWAFAFLPVLLVALILPAPYSLFLYKRLERDGKLESQQQQPVAAE